MIWGMEYNLYQQHEKGKRLLPRTLLALKAMNRSTVLNNKGNNKSKRSNDLSRFELEKDNELEYIIS